MTQIDDLHRRWRKDADYNGAYHALGEQFDRAGSPIEAKTMVRLSPQHAKKRKTRGRALRESTRKCALVD